MPSALPEGDPPPPDGSLPAAALAAAAGRPFGAYVHVPFCRTRCGYCDFNTYTAAELDSAPGAGQDSYRSAVAAELALAHRVVGRREAATVFVGGGTPTLLPAADLAGLLHGVRDHLGLAPGAEVTTESNPESVDGPYLAALRRAGFTRVSFGMQSAVPHVLHTLDRTHTPGRPAAAVREARAAGFDSVSLDLIYGTPGESLADWRTSVGTALAAGPDHVSAYALVVEPGTRMAAQVRRGVLALPDDDDLADKYLLAEELLSAAGFAAYEVSNWARGPQHRCRHNLGYWRGDPWWGFGPGAHSHVGGVRWWNVKHPAAYAARLADGASPAYARETLTAAERRTERVLLEVRLADGLDPDVLTRTERSRLPGLRARGLLDGAPARVRLTRTGRLLADAVVRDLLD